MEIDKMLEGIAAELKGTSLQEITQSLKNKKAVLVQLDAKVKKAIDSINTSLSQIENLGNIKKTAVKISKKKTSKLPATEIVPAIKGKPGRKKKAEKLVSEGTDNLAAAPKKGKGKKKAVTAKTRKASSSPKNSLTYKEMILQVLKENGPLEPLAIKTALVEKYGMTDKEAAQNSGYHLTTLVGKKIISRKKENKKSFYSIENA